MFANAIRQFYDYHFTENRKTWDDYIVPLPHEQFIQEASYSHGSVRNQIVHIMSTDEAWFSDLGAVEVTEPLDADEANDRKSIRQRWDLLEQDMRNYLAKITDERLFEKPFGGGEDKDLILWQVLLHVVNHGTDHRAQLLRTLNDLGVKTVSQDYIFYVYEHP